MAAAAAASSFYDITELTSNGSPLSFATFKGKVVYGVNVASNWGFTKREYKLFRNLASEFGSELAIIAFPSNEFGNQEFDSDSEVEKFAQSQKFPGTLMKTTEVLPTAKAQCTTYRYIFSHIPDFNIKWNFKGKFLVGKNGVVQATTDPRVDITTFLAKNNSKI